MIKSELIARLGCKQDHLAERDVALCVNNILDKMTTCLASGGRIEIRDFGSWSLHYRPSRRAHNPKTGEKLTTSPKHAVHFKPGKAMKERVDATKDIPIKEAKNDK